MLLRSPVKSLSMICLLALSAACSLPVYAQTSPALQKYLDLKLFADTREDVERIYGKGESAPIKYNVTYPLRDGFLLVMYSWGGECRGYYKDWNVPEWTVTKVSYSFFRNEPKVKDLIGGDRRFKKSAYGDVVGQVKYFDETRGITIYSDESSKRADTIGIEASARDEEKYGCGKE